MSGNAESPRRRRNARGEGSRLRADIIAAASQILRRDGGAHAVTLRAVAREVGIAAPSIYPHFDDPHQILAAVTAEAFAVLKDRLATARDAAGRDPAARLRAACVEYLQFSRAEPHLYLVMFGGLWNAGEAVAAESLSVAEATRLGQDAFSVLATALADAAAEGEAATQNAESDAVALWLGLHGLAHANLVTPMFPFPADIAERVIASLAHLAPAVAVAGPAARRSKRRVTHPPPDGRPASG